MSSLPPVVLFCPLFHISAARRTISSGPQDVWVEFRNASKWQAELLFRDFFPLTDGDGDDISETYLGASSS